MRFELPAEKMLVHELDLSLRWGDMDAMGHIDNTLYFRYLESCRLDWEYKLGASTDLSGQGPVIVNALCNFLRQLTCPGEVRVTMHLAEVGPSSIDSHHTIERLDEPRPVYAEGGARMVWTDYVAKKSAPIPDWFRARLA
jgi:acyl-CoA thioester hydrolase